MASDSRDRLSRLALPAILVVSAILLLWGLDDRLLWQDEANTAVIARNILNVGYPCGWDGRNFFPHESLRSIANPRHLITHQTWLQYYLLAASFLILGPTTFAARLPCAILGVGTVWLTYRLGRSLSGRRRLGLLAASLLTISVPFLLHARQARSYAPAMFFTVAVLSTYLRATDPMAGRSRQWVAFALSGALLFHSHPLIFLATMAGVGCHFLLFHVRSRRLVPFTLSLGAVAVLTTPYLYPLLSYYDPAKVNYPHSEVLSRGLSFYLKQVNLSLVPFPVLAMAAVPFFRSLRARARGETLAAGEANSTGAVSVPGEALLWIVFAASLAVAIGMPLVRKPSFNFRYVVGCLPVASLLVARLVGWVHESSRAAALVLVVLAGGTNLFSLPVHLLLGGRANPDLTLADYFRSLAVRFRGPDEGIIRFLNRWAQPDDWVAASYGEMPIMFYTPLRVAFRRAGHEHPPPQGLPTGPDDPVRWVVGRVGREQDYAGWYRRVVYGRDPRYEAITLDVPDLRWGSIPEPGLYPVTAPTDGERVRVFYYPSTRMVRESRFPRPLLDYRISTELARSREGWTLRSSATATLPKERYLEILSLDADVVDSRGRVVLESSTRLDHAAAASPLEWERALSGALPERFSLRVGFTYRYDVPFLDRSRRVAKAKWVLGPAPFESRREEDRYRLDVRTFRFSEGDASTGFSLVVGMQEAGGRGRVWGSLMGGHWDGGFGDDGDVILDPYLALACPGSEGRSVIPLAGGPVGGPRASHRTVTLAPVEAVSDEISMESGCDLRVGYRAYRSDARPDQEWGVAEETALAIDP